MPEKASLHSFQEGFTMYSVVLLAAMTAGGESADFGRRGGCHGCYGGGCWGCRGYSYGCGGCYGYSYGCGGCRGYSYGCGGGYGCSGYVSTGCYGCYGYVAAPVAGKTVVQADGPPARVIVQVPEGAKLTVDGEVTQSTAAVRTFETPALPAGRSYTYQLKVEYQQDGKAVTRSRTVTLESGRTVNLDLTKPVEGVASR
jgi:uncharacterized protein (TIGR03000 family)